MSAQLDFLRDNVRDLKKQLQEATNELHAQMKAEAPFPVGTVVWARAHGHERECIVRRLYVRHDSLRYSVSIRKKDGTWGEAEHDCWGARPITERPDLPANSGTAS